MGMFFGSSGKVARENGLAPYEEIESVYSCVEDGGIHHYWFNDEEELYDND